MVTVACMLLKACVLCAVVVTLEPLPGAETYVNGKQIAEAVVLKQGPAPSSRFYCENSTSCGQQLTTRSLGDR